MFADLFQTTILCNTQIHQQNWVGLGLGCTVLRYHLSQTGAKLLEGSVCIRLSAHWPRSVQRDPPRQPPSVAGVCVWNY